MASTYSTNLAIELIGTGDQAGAWGNTTNTNLGTLIEQAISGYVTQAVSTGTDTTITIPNGATGVARNMYIELTGTGGTNTNLIVPANKKLYFIFNNTTGAVTVKVSGQTGVSVPQGKKVVLTSNGTDIVNGLNYIADFGSNSATITQLTATSATITNLTLTSLVISNLSIASANVTTLTSASATITNLLATSLTVSGNTFLATSSGNVGIGTSSPAYKLDVNGQARLGGTAGLFVGIGTAFSSGQAEAYTTSTTPMGIGTAGAAPLRFYTNSNFNAVLDSSGNLGLGDTSPSSNGKLSIIIPSIASYNASTAAWNASNGTGAMRLWIANAAYSGVGANEPWLHSYQNINIGSDASIAIKFINNGSERMRLDSSGNLGLGVTPSAWGGTFKAFTLGAGGNQGSIAGQTDANRLNLISNGFFNGTNWIYGNGVGSGWYRINQNVHEWYTAPSGTAGNTITFTQAMTLSSGASNDRTNLLIGTTTSAYETAGRGVIEVNGSSSALIAVKSGDTARGYFAAGSTATELASVGASQPLLFTTNSAERARIDTSGNLGMVNAPSAWGSASRAIQIWSGASYGYNSNDGGTFLGSNFFYNSSNVTAYVATAAASLYYQVGGQHRWYNAPSGTAGNTISFTQAMTLDASGNLGVGTTSPTSIANYKTVTVNGTTGSLVDLASNGTVGARIQCDTSYPGMALFGLTNHPMVFGTNAVERARITAGGFFKASDTGTYDGVTQAYHEFVSSLNSVAIRLIGTNANMTDDVQQNNAIRSANSAYDLFTAFSGNFGDQEFALRGDGNGYADGTWNNNGADYAEYFESATGGALTVGATVVLEGNKVREATASDPVSAIMGVVRPKEPSKASMVVGNTAWNKWANKYLTDDFDRYIMEDHDVVEWTDEDGKQHSYESHNIPDGVTVPADAVRKTHDEKGNKFQHYKLNPAWDKDAEYTPREKRDEWIIVGLVGQVKVLKGKPVNDRWIKMRDVSAAVEEWMIR